MPATPADGRPRLHFTPASGWVNDPHGLTWHGGRYHSFFQHVPGRAAWEIGIHWGHAVSDDLVHWTERPVVLSPDRDDVGVWSGCLVTADDGSARIFYTGVGSDPGLGTVRVARPLDDDWEAWRKGGVVVAAPDDLDLRELRDPCVLRDGDAWRMVVGAGLADGTAAALTWTSTDLDAWTYDGVLASRHTDETDPVWTGSGWECVQLFPLGDRWVLLVSVWDRDVTHGEAYAVGDLVDGRFSGGPWRQLTYGPSPYAGSAFTDSEGRRCLVHWLRGVADPAGRWAGAHSVPHVLRLDGDRVVAGPHPAVRDACEPLGPGTRTIGGAELTLDDGRLAVRLAEGSFQMPCAGGEVLVLVDGPVVEVFGPEGVAGFSLPAPARSVS